MGFEYDVATDRELHDEGAELLERYNVVLHRSHPEYYSTRMLDAWEEYLAGGGAACTWAERLLLDHRVAPGEAST